MTDETEDSALVLSMRQGIVERIDAAGGDWQRFIALDFSASVLNLLSDAILGELRTRLATGQLIQARHLRALGLPGLVAGGVPDEAVVRGVESRGAPIIRVHFYPVGGRA